MALYFQWVLYGGPHEFSPATVSIHSIIIHTVMIGTSERFPHQGSCGSDGIKGSPVALNPPDEEMKKARLLELLVLTTPVPVWPGCTRQRDWVLEDTEEWNGKGVPKCPGRITHSGIRYSDTAGYQCLDGSLSSNRWLSIEK
ncbi:uncharacterized protein LOC143756989 isoform X2 [Siphateles boraxobius]|uniref:uncharacterized protein LOC143756989 isoform X2 n=1 Tax=Siphateles boraxobius TaxID=180520 RepID=UPI00406364D0